MAPTHGISPSRKVDPDVSAHPRHLPFGHAEIAGFPRHIGAERRAGGASGERDQVEDHVEPDRPIDAGNDDQPLEDLLERFDPCADRLRGRCQNREGQAVLWLHRHQLALRADKFLLESGQRMTRELVRREAPKPTGTPTTSEPARLSAGTTSLVDHPGGFGEERAALSGDRRRARGVEQLIRLGSQIGAAEQRNWRRNQAGEVEGATASTSRKSVAMPLAAGATRMPSGAQSRASRSSRMVAPGPSGSAIAQHRPLGIAEQAVGLGDEPGAANIRGLRQPGGVTGWPRPSSPGCRSGGARGEARDDQRGDQRVAVDRLVEQEADVALGERATLARRDKPEQARHGVEPKAARGISAPRVSGRSAKLPPRTGQVFRSTNARIALADGCRARCTISRREFVAVGTRTERVRRSAPAGLGPVAQSRTDRCPAPSRSKPNSGWASNWRRLGRGASKRISITRSVIATTSSIAPTVSLMGLRLEAAIWRLKIRTTSLAVIGRPLGHSALARRKCS